MGHAGYVPWHLRGQLERMALQEGTPASVALCASATVAVAMHAVGEVVASCSVCRLQDFGQVRHRQHDVVSFGQCSLVS